MSHVGLDWQEYVRFNEGYLRPIEVDALIGSETKARSELGWEVDGLKLVRPMDGANVEALAQIGSPQIGTLRLTSWTSKRNATSIEARDGEIVELGEVVLDYSRTQQFKIEAWPKSLRVPQDDLRAG